MVNYIVSIYCGRRRAGLQTDFKMLLDKHIEFLSSNPDDIDGFTFVINETNIKYDQYCIDTINKFIEKSSLKGNLFTRENVGGSYGAWEKGIMETYSKYDYSFLIEDDYIPNLKNTVSYFLQKIKNHSFVASYWDDNHAAVSNGLFNNSLVLPTLEKHNRLFDLDTPNKSREPFTKYQRNFLNFVESKFTDITDIGYTEFQRWKDVEYVIFTNNKLPLLIKPIKQFYD
tara:strand:- start:764 stop:1447 length:684 start_codon:yes stop_codon:yes gene_type:complete